MTQREIVEMILRRYEKILSESFKNFLQELRAEVDNYTTIPNSRKDFVLNGLQELAFQETYDRVDLSRAKLIIVNNGASPW